LSSLSTLNFYLSASDIKTNNPNPAKTGYNKKLEYCNSTFLDELYLQMNQQMGKQFYNLEGEVMLLGE